MDILGKCPRIADTYGILWKGWKFGQTRKSDRPFIEVESDRTDRLKTPFKRAIVESLMRHYFLMILSNINEICCIAGNFLR